MLEDLNEIIRLKCYSCKRSNEGTYFELFGDLPSLLLLSLRCKCGGEIYLSMTGEYK